MSLVSGLTHMADAQTAALPAPPDPGPALMSIPFFEPVKNPDKALIARYRQKEISVVDFGAIGDGKSHPLREKFKTQAAIDKKYGKGLYTLEDEIDFVAVMEAIRVAKAIAVHDPSQVTLNINTVYVPAGLYVINRTITITDMYGWTLRGDGRQQTSFKIDVPMPLFAITRSSFVKFTSFSIESHIGSLSTGFYINNDGRNGNPVFHLLFDSLIFQWVYKGIQIEGTSMTDTALFSGIRFVQCLKAFELNNPQGMNYTFTGCAFELYGGDSIYAPFKAGDVKVFHVKAGGNITVLGGSIIHAGTTLLLEPQDPKTPGLGGSSAINYSNGMFNFIGVRWEQEGGSTSPVLFDAKDEGAMEARINFTGCTIYQRFAARNQAVGKLHSGMNVTFRDSSFNFGHIQEVIDPKQEARKGALLIDNTSRIEYKQAENAPYHHLYKNETLWVPAK